MSLIDLSNRIIARKNLLILVVITLAAILLAVSASQYSIQTSNEIRKIASDDIALNARNEAYDLSRIVVNKIDSVTTNLQVLANAPSIQAGNARDITQLFDSAQYSTEDLTEYYMWLDSQGAVLSASNIARASYQYNSMWQTEKPTFLTMPQKTASIYYSEIIKSPVDNIERLYIAYPIIYSLQEGATDRSGDFNGVIVASIRLDTLGAILTNELSPTFASDVSLTDISGQMIYSVDSSVIGKNVFENAAYLTSPIIMELSDDAKTQVEEFVRDSNSRRQAALLTADLDGNLITVSSYPIVQNGDHFWTLYITAPHIFTDSVDNLLAKQDTFIIITLTVIGSIAVGVGYLVLSWNRRLERVIESRTLELKGANISLTESNSKLACANEQLEVHAKLQREFVDIAAHELRTPIMPILGISDLLESKFQQSKNDEIQLKKNDFELLSRNARRLERLAIDILDVTKIETQSLRLNLEHFNLYDLVDVAVNDVKNQFPNNNVTYHIQLDKEIMIFADKSRIGQALTNLLHNAAKFTDLGSITVSGKVERDHIHNNKNTITISVSDTGVGIDSEVMPRLFTKFMNKAGDDRQQIGSGLGLYIAKGVIDAHGGKIWAENNMDGRGCTVRFQIPLSIRTVAKIQS